MTKYYKKIAMPAAGKSYGAIKYIEERIKEEGKKYVIAAISVNLCKQIQEDISPEINTRLLISENSNRLQLVRDRLADALEEKEDDILIITHKTLLNSYGTLKAEGWSIIVDELPVLHTAKWLKIPSLEDDSLSRWLVEASPDNDMGKWKSMEIKVGCENKLEKYLEDFETLQEDESFINKNSIQGLQGALHQGTKLLRRQEEDCTVEYAFNYVYNPNILFQGFEEVVFLCAEFDKQLTGLLFKHKFNISVEDKQEISLRQTEYHKPERIKIYPLIKPPRAFSRTLSEMWYCPETKRSYHKRLTDIPNTLEFFEHMVDVASKIVGDKGYIYTVNKFRDAMISNGDYEFLQERDSVEKLKYNPHGLNSYMKYNVALGMFCCNPSQTQSILLSQLDKDCNVEGGTFRKGYETTAMLDPVFQLITRCKIRDFDELEEIICIVPDYRCCEYLTNSWFKGAEVITDFAIEIDNPLGAPKRFTGIFEMNDKEEKHIQRKAAKEFGTIKNMDTSNQEHLEIVNNWLSDYRNKQKLKSRGNKWQ